MHPTESRGITMKYLLVIVALGAGLAGCAMQTTEAEQGYYASGRLPDPALQKQMDDKERAQEQSARDFAQPRGLWY